jgi:hypothetical protein
VLPDDLTIPPYAYPPQREAFALFDQYMDQATAPAQGAVAILVSADGSPRHTGICVWADDKWKCVGVDVNGHRPWVTMTPLDMEYVWRFYDFRLP